MGKKYKCKHCGDYSEDSIKTPIARFCSFEHAYEYGKQKSEKDKAKAIKKQAAKVTKKAKKDRVRIKKRKQELKTLNELKKEAQAAFNKYIRIRDKNNPCISCNSVIQSKYGGAMDAGHYRSRGSAAHLSFNVFNCHAQCVKCNRYLSGNIQDYRHGLINKIGMKKVSQLEANNVTVKFSRDYLVRVKKYSAGKAGCMRKDLGDLLNNH